MAGFSKLVLAIDVQPFKPTERLDEQHHTRPCLHRLTDNSSWLQSPAMSPFQVLKAVLASLAQPTSLSKPVAWPKAKSSEAAEEAAQPSLPSPPQPSAFKPSAAVFLLDPSGWLNLAAPVSASSLAHVRSPQSPLSLHIFPLHCLDLDDLEFSGHAWMHLSSHMTTQP